MMGCARVLSRPPRPTWALHPPPRGRCRWSLRGQRGCGKMMLVCPSPTSSPPLSHLRLVFLLLLVSLFSCARKFCCTAVLCSHAFSAMRYLCPVSCLRCLGGCVFRVFFNHILTSSRCSQREPEVASAHTEANHPQSARATPSTSHSRLKPRSYAP